MTMAFIAEFELSTVTSMNVSDFARQSSTEQIIATQFFTHVHRHHAQLNKTNSTLLTNNINLIMGLTSSEIAMMTAQILIGLVGVIGNGFVIVVIACYTTMHRQLTNVFVVNQSAIDSLSSFIMIALIASGSGSGSGSGWYAPLLVDGQFGSELYCRVWQSGFLQWAFFTSSTYNLVVLALERYLKIIHPVVYKTSFTKVKVRIFLVFVWLVGLVYTGSYGIPTTIVSGTTCLLVVAWNSGVTRIAVGYISALVQYFIPALVFLLTYTLMIRSLRRSGPGKTSVSPLPKTMPSQQRHGSLGRGGDYRDMRIRAQRNLTKTCILISMSFFVCWSANEWYYFLYIIGLPLAHSGPIYNFTVIMVSLHCCINPFIYIVNYRQFRNAVKKILARPKINPSISADRAN